MTDAKPYAEVPFRDVDAKRNRRWPFWLARATTSALTVLAVTQAVFAGSFLGGQYNALMLHSVGAKATTLLSAVQVIVLVFVIRAGGPRRLMAVGLVLPLLLVAEFASGELRLTGLHVPLGVLLVAFILQLTAWVWRLPTTRRPAEPSQASL
ncbi:hypothetical protein [Mycobacterium noviomagense]|nr:hypothetical protein [Mycobacterium noviomagense]